MIITFLFFTGVLVPVIPSLSPGVLTQNWGRARGVSWPRHWPGLPRPQAWPLTLTGGSPGDTDHGSCVMFHLSSIIVITANLSRQRVINHNMFICSLTDRPLWLTVNNILIIRSISEINYSFAHGFRCILLPINSFIIEMLHWTLNFSASGSLPCA